MSLNTHSAGQSRPARYFVQFVNSDQRGTSEHQYYVDARSPNEAKSNAPDIARFQKKAVLAVRKMATAAAEERRDVIEALAGEGLSRNAMAARLNDASVETSRGGYGQRRQSSG